MDRSQRHRLSPAEGHKYGRASLIDLLNEQLADTIDLRLQVRQAYFNVNGPYAATLRTVFDGMTEELRQFEDLIAGIISAFGGHPIAALRVVADESSLENYPLDVLNAHDHLKALLSSYSQYDRDLRQHIQSAQELGYRDTGDALNVISKSNVRALSLIEALIEGLALGLHTDKLPKWTSAFDHRSESDHGANSK